MNLILFGFMAVGKSTIGKILAEKLNYSFIDIDAEIVKTAEMEIIDIFNIKGEQEFRKIEKQVINNFSHRKKLVIACGGGAVLDPINVKELKKGSYMVLLTADINEVIKRTKDDKSRPLLNSNNRRKKIKDLLTSRMLTYVKIADLIIDTTGISPTIVTQKILTNLEDRL